MANNFTTTNSRKGGCLFKLLSIIGLVVIVLATTLYFTLGYIADYALKTITADTDITSGIDDLKLKPTEQSLEITGFYLTNPRDKYKEKNALAFDRAFVDLDFSISDFFAKDLVVIEEIDIDGLKVNIAKASGLNTKTNFHEIIEIFQKKYPSDKKEKDKKADKKEGLKYIIKEITFTNGALSATYLGQTANLKLPEFKIENIGVEEGGITMGEVINQMLPVIIKQSEKQMKENGVELYKELGNISSEMLKDLKKDGKEILESVKKGSYEDAIKKGENIIKGLGF